MSQINRVPPHDDEAERAVLGALLQDKDALEITEQYLDGDDFYSGANRRIYQAIRDLMQRGYAADIITVRSTLEQNGGLDTVGGTAYIASLTGVVPSIANTEYYAKIVFACSVKRALFKAANAIIDEVFDESVAYGEILDKAQRDIFSIAENKKEITYKKLKDLVLSQLNRQTSEKGAQLSNIRASGAIEQDADLIMFLERKVGETAAKINVVKQRQGEVGEVDIVFLPHYTRFENLAREE